MQALCDALSAVLAVVIGFGVFAMLLATYFVGNSIEAVHAWIHDGNEGDEIGAWPQVILSRAR